MVAPVRYTFQKQQERISRRQLCERLDEFGWIATPPDEDLGEDFIVHIYLQGRATGVTFHLQLKSVTNLNERRKDDFLVYAFEVKDLKHWEAFSLPVVLMVWDVELREGRWALVDDVISEMDRRRPNWRDKKSKVRVYIPQLNTTDDTGLVKLKQSIGRHLYSNIAKGRQLTGNIKLRFPRTAEGKVAYKTLEHGIKKGDIFLIKKEFIQEFEVSDWWTSWFGDFLENSDIFIPSFVSSKTVSIYVDVIGVNGETSYIPAIELKIVKFGLEVIQLSNEYQNSPIHFYFTIPRSDEGKKCCINIKLNHLGRNVHETRDAIRFLNIITTGGKMRINFLTYDKPPLTVIIPPNPENAVNPEYLQLIDKLCVIQSQIGQFLQIPDDDDLTDADIEAIDEFIDIIECGKTTKRVKEITIELVNIFTDAILDSHAQQKPIRMKYSAESFVEIFDSKIPTGLATWHITGTPKLSAVELKEIIKSLSPNDPLFLKFVDVEIIEVFPDWFIREAQRLSQLLAEKFEIEAIYLFGSLVWSDIHTPETDIDLAVSGLPEARFLEAVSYLERESKFPIDLIDLSKASDHLRQRILAEGKLLYEREPVAAFSRRFSR